MSMNWLVTAALFASACTAVDDQGPALTRIDLDDTIGSSKQDAGAALASVLEGQEFEVRGVITLIEEDREVTGFLSPCSEPEASDVAYRRSEMSDRQAFNEAWNEALSGGLSAEEYQEFLGDAVHQGAFGWMLKIEVDRVVAAEVEPQRCDIFRVQPSNTPLEITSVRLIGTVRLLGER